MTAPVTENAVERLKAEGFLVIQIGKPVSHLISATFEAAQHFFRAPIQYKSRNRLPDDCGYRGVGIEYSRSPDRPDPVESFTASIRTREVAQNLEWPVATVLHDQMVSVIDVLEPIAEALTIQLAERFGGATRGDTLAGAFRRWSFLQLNYSRPADGTVPFINELHEDGHLLTLACATGPGLEIQTAESAFLPMTTALGEILVMPGEIAWLLSGGYIRPLYHRVRRAPQCSERMALLFFGDVNPRLCDPWHHNEINANVDIGARVLTNATRFGLSGLILE